MRQCTYAKEQIICKDEKQITDLPEKAQRTFRKTHESALKQYKSPSKRRKRSDTPEKVAHKTAWSAVKKKYKKSGSKWVKKQDSSSSSSKTGKKKSKK